MEISVYKSTSWKTLPWNQFRRKVFNLQCKIYEALQKNDIKKTIKLQKCLINSSYTHYIAIRELTEINTGRKLSGIDGQLMLTCKEKVRFANRIGAEIKHWKHSPVRKINIVHTQSPDTINPSFSLPNIEDRIIQFIWKLALEPAHEATFLQTSYGFRIGKTAWDVQKYLIYYLKNFPTQIGAKVISIDLGNSLTLMNYEPLLNKIVLPYKQKTNVYRALKMGILDGCLLTISYHYSLTNLCFLLLNIIFHGIEKLHNFSTNSKLIPLGLRYGTNLLYSFIEEEHELIYKLDTFLHTVGFPLKVSKVQIFHSLQKIEFLGWCFVVKPNGKIITYPDKHDWLIYKTEIKLILKNSNYKIETRVEKIRLRSSTWYNYHCFCDFSKLKSLLYTLKSWFTKYLRFHTRIPKLERSKLLKRGFSFTTIKID